MMTHRERALAILSHCEADRPAIDLGATAMSGMTAWTNRALRERLGLPGGPTRIFDPGSMIAAIDEPLLDRFGVDFLRVPEAFRCTEYRPVTFWDGQEMLVPVDLPLRETPEGDLLVLRADGGTAARMPRGGRYFDAPELGAEAMFDLPDLRTLAPALYLPPPDLDPGFLKAERSRFASIYANTDRALVTRPPFGMPCGYSPHQFAWGMLMLEEPALCREMIQAQAEAMASRAEQWLTAVGEYVAVVCLSGNDYGLQDREAVPPELFGEIIAPGWKRVNDVIHRVSTVKTWVHCCGSIPNIIPHMIDAGVDCLNPVQWTAAGMDPQWLKTTFGDRIVFWGGAINTQRTFPQGAPAEVADEARALLDIFAPGGGYVVNPIHNIQADVPVDNIIALYDTALAWRY